ncbi:MAG: dihydropyrimidinase [Planctomycetota bacterium]|nr:MAG: dihydropyrimidinase [Planctomycetota bacterium]
MGLFIQGGQIVTGDAVFDGDILCENGIITQIGKNLQPPQNAEVIDAKGKLVFPGFVDPHTHIYLPFMGTYAKDNYETGSIAALCGGTTTFIDFVLPNRGESPKKALETWKSKSKGLSCCDYTYHMGVTWFNEEVEKELREIVEKEGISSFKVFLAYKGALGVDDYELYQTLRLAKELGVIVTAHCENADLVAELQKKLVEAGKIGPEYHYESRPPLVEAEGTRHICTFANLLGTHIYIVHLSCEEALKEAIKARIQGTNVLVETLIQFLLLDKTYAECPNFEGAKYVMSPPLREKKNQDVLWKALAGGLVSTVATDHAPFDTEQKKMGKDNFCLIPNGIPAIEDRVRMLYTYGVAENRISLNQFVQVASTNAAKIFGLFPKKGCLAVGSDADIVVYDPSYEGTISAQTHHMNIDYSAFEGFKVKGRCSLVTVRGEIQVRDGEFVGKKGIGQFLPRKGIYK